MQHTIGKRLVIHTWLACLLASLVLAPALAAEKTAPLKINEKPRLLVLLRFYDSAMAPYQHWPKNQQLTILHLWATWCVPCLDELPKLDTFSTQYKDTQIIFLPVALNKELEDVTGFYSKHGIKKLPVYIDPTMKIFRELEVYTLPATLFIDANGREIARIEGPADWQSASLRDFIARRLPH